MTLNDFKAIIDYQFAYITKHKNITAETLDEKYAYITGLTKLFSEPKTIEAAITELGEDTEKIDELLTRLSWAIPGGAGRGIRGNVADVNNDGDVDEDDVTELKTIIAKETKTEEDIKKGDLNKDGKVDNDDKDLLDTALSEVTPEVNPETPKTPVNPETPETPVNPETPENEDKDETGI